MKTDIEKLNEVHRLIICFAAIIILYSTVFPFTT